MKKMRVKDVGATINLGNYSSLHITIGEPAEFAGLDIGRAEEYLKNVAKSVDGVLNLPEKAKKEGSKVKAKEKELVPQETGEKVVSFGGTEYAFYDHSEHKYTSKDGIEYCSVTQMLDSFYPFNSKNVIKQEYMDFASSFGNMVHTAIQNSIIGYKPSKKLVEDIVDKTLKEMGEYAKSFVERVIIYPDQELAGRFDILTLGKDGEYTLWDVKTNTELTNKVDCSLPDPLKKRYSQFWNPETTYGKHCLQLNIYRHMIEATSDYKISNLKIIHIPDSFSGIIDVPIVDVSDLFSAFGAIR